MDIKNFCTALHNTAATNDSRTHFYVPTLNLSIEYSRAALSTQDMTTFYDKDSGEEIITVPANIKEISTWNQWENHLKISQHSPVYRIIKAIFDGTIFPSKNPDDAYGERLDAGCINGYEL